MASEGSDSLETAVSFILRLLSSLLLPAWGVITLVLGILFGMPWWIATGLAIVATGVVLFAGSPIIRPSR
jgi:hypothetical protein